MSFQKNAVNGRNGFEVSYKKDQPEEQLGEWFGNGELIDDLIGQKDNCFRKKKGHKRK